MQLVVEVEARDPWDIHLAMNSERVQHVAAGAGRKADRVTVARYVVRFWFRSWQLMPADVGQSGIPVYGCIRIGVNWVCTGTCYGLKFDATALVLS